jgi:hypothetical protein
MREINCYGGIVKVDATDYDELIKYTWSVWADGTTRYARRKYGGSNISMHRHIMNPSIDMEVDHMNGDGLDNTRKNLRICSRKENAQRNTKQQNKKLSRFKGVYFHHYRWEAAIQFDGKQCHLGTFKTEIEAAQKYNEAAQRHFGDFAKLNNIEELATGEFKIEIKEGEG